jgi:hypothetical protein
LRTLRTHAIAYIHTFRLLASMTWTWDVFQFSRYI